MPESRPALLVHGGVGELANAAQEAAREGCRTAAAAGWAVLERGGHALDAVEAAVRALEDEPLFNAGYGSVLQRDGVVRTDASLMNGPDRRAGAVASVTGVANPVSLARRVMEDGRHVLLVGPAAEAFADEVGEPRVDPGAMVAPDQGERWKRHHGTVGCVAVDGRGVLAAGTSTGGTFGALPGRVGDSPLIGAGTWADDRVAVSCTGHGESIIRTNLAAGVSWRLAGAGLEVALAAALADLDARVGGKAGLIAVDASGRLSHRHNDVHMAVGLADAGGLRTSL